MSRLGITVVCTRQLQEAHPRWQQCHFGTTASFTHEHTCRWENQKHLWVTRLEKVTGGIDAKWTSWHAEGDKRPSMWAPWKQIKLVHPAQILTMAGIQLHEAVVIQEPERGRWAYTWPWSIRSRLTLTDLCLLGRVITVLGTWTCYPGLTGGLWLSYSSPGTHLLPLM